MNVMKKESELLPRVKSVFSDFFETPVEKFFDMNIWNNRFLSKVPATNIWSNNKEYTIELAVPGMKKEDFKVTIEHGMLIISAEKEESKEESKKDFTRKEYSFNSFSRSFYLPDVVNAEKIDAHYDNGILKLVIPKKEEAKKLEGKQIKVS